MKLLFVVLIIISLIDCSEDESRNRRDGRDRNPELTDDNLNGGKADTDEDSEEKGGKKPKEPPINSFKIAQNISNFKSIKKDSSVCDFKNDHMTGGLFFSGANLMAPDGSYTTVPTKIFKNSPGMNWGDDFQYMSKYHLFKNDTLILPFKYDKHDIRYAKYGDWCSKKKKDCIVYAIFKGEIYEPMYPDTDYLYNGKLLILIVFSDQLLDFSLCSKS